MIMISEDDARKKAMYGLRFEFGGNMLHLGRKRETGEHYVFSILISYPRLPETKEYELEFDDTKMVGEIIINKSTGDMTHTPMCVLQNRVGEIKESGYVNYSEN